MLVSISPGRAVRPMSTHSTVILLDLQLIEIRIRVAKHPVGIGAGNKVFQIGK